MSVLFIVDNSYSTNKYLKLYLDAVNGIINLQKKLYPQSLLTFATFNIKYNFHCVRKEISTLTRDMNSDDFKCDGITALYDCVTIILNNTIKFHNEIQTGPSLCIILTDGEDNASRKTNMRQCALQIAIAKSQGYKFIFLGTTEKSVEIGKRMGCEITILYEPSKKSLDNVLDIFTELLQHPNQKIDLDLREITQGICDMKM